MPSSYARHSPSNATYSPSSYAYARNSPSSYARSSPHVSANSSNASSESHGIAPSQPKALHDGSATDPCHAKAVFAPGGLPNVPGRLPLAPWHSPAHQTPLPPGPVAAADEGTDEAPRTDDGYIMQEEEEEEEEPQLGYYLQLFLKSKTNKPRSRRKERKRRSQRPQRLKRRRKGHL